MDVDVIDRVPREGLEGARVLVVVGGCGDLRECLPTLEYLAGAGSRIVMAANFGDEGSVRAAAELCHLTGLEVRRLSGPLDDVAPATVWASSRHEILMLPDLAGHPGEAVNDPDFARRLGSLAEIYCNDAFPLAHLGLASSVGIVRFVETAVAGLGMARRVSSIEAAIEHVTSPSVAIVGGTGLEEKSGLLFRLCELVDDLFIGGALCFPFLRARGIEIGGASVDDDLVPVARDILDWASDRTRILLPVDFVTVNRSANTPETIDAAELRATQIPMDIGPRTIRQVEALLSAARSLFWNGPLGVWEIESFAGGTCKLAGAAAARAAEGLRGVIWGDSLSRAVREFAGDSGPLRALAAPSAPASRLVSGQPLLALEALRKSSHARLRKVVLPIDQSAHARELLAGAASLLEGTTSEIHLLFIRHPSRRRHDRELLLEANRMFDGANAVLARFRAKATAEVTTEGDTAECVLQYASDIGADLVAVPWRDVQAPVRRLAGDWSRAVKRRATCPLLVVPVQGRD